MKFRLTAFLAISTLLLSACNFTLAADITPPPDYVPPTPMPTLGPLHPPQPPDVKAGAAIFAENCVPCHGEKGLGDGPQGQQLPVPVAALGLPETARKDSPARWYTTVSQGNIERFMPPFVSLSDQQRWDVVTYAMSLHITPEQLQQGKELFESNCSGCDISFFTDQERMSSLSEDDLVKIIKEGNSSVPAFGANLSEDGLYAVAAYLRTLTFSASQPTPTAIPVSETPATPEAGTPSAAETPIEGTPQAEVTNEPAVEGAGTVTGTVVNGSGADLPESLAVTLRGFDHAQDASGPQETFSANGSVGSDGAFVFENVELPEGRILLAEVARDGITYQSEFAVVEAGASSIALPPVTIYESNNHYDNLTFKQIHLAFDFGAADTFQVFEIYTFSNTSNQAIVIATDGTSMPFVSVPEGATDVGFEAGQDTNPFVSAQGGFAILPSEETYSLIAFFTLPYNTRGTLVEQPFPAAAESVLAFLPEGVKLQSERFSESGAQQISNTNFLTYTAKDIKPGEVLAFTLSGRPSEAGTGGFLGLNQTLIFGAGALGLALIVLGVWMYLRDRNQPGEFDDDEFENTQDVMDAIIALDDLHRAGKIPDEAYKTRRAELKTQLKEMQ